MSCYTVKWQVTMVSLFSKPKILYLPHTNTNLTMHHCNSSKTVIYRKGIPFTELRSINICSAKFF